MSRTLSNLDREALLQKIEAARPAQAARQEFDASSDELARDMAHLRSNDAATIRGALRRDGVRSPLLAPQLLELLARDDVARDAMHALAPLVPVILGVILDVVLDEQRSPQVRRRAARLLKSVPSQRAANGLVLALGASPFDVRYACGRVLVGLREQNADLRFDAAEMFEHAKRQLEGQSQDPRALEHAFDVLSLAAPREAIQLAYGALQSSDKFLRGVALEYLDVVLPGDVRAAMMPRLSARPRPSDGRPSGRALDDLLKSKEAIRSHLDELRRSRDPDAEPSA